MKISTVKYFLFLLFRAVAVVDAAHFNGGTIRWVPTNPYDNSSSVTIAIIQTYSWAYPTMRCANNVPISTSGRSGSNANLICVTDCYTDGNYSAKPIDILTDCISVSSSLGMMTSQRSVNISLTAGAHFYLANVGTAWSALNYPVETGLEWSIVTFIDLRMRSDGFINTPPVATVVSPQYAIVNRTTQIRIPVSDANVGDDVRCRWSTYIPGYRRRRRSKEDRHTSRQYMNFSPSKQIGHEAIIQKRKAAVTTSPCTGRCPSFCDEYCDCSCAPCDPTICINIECEEYYGCDFSTTITATTATTTTTAETTTSTIDTPGTLRSTLSYSTRQPIDECGGICHPSSVPSGTDLSNCTITLKGLRPRTWYAVAIQVKDLQVVVLVVVYRASGFSVLVDK